jgi:Linear amide C-N hydrolases, choloylglycine hydrolase family
VEEAGVSARNRRVDPERRARWWAVGTVVVGVAGLVVGVITWPHAAPASVPAQPPASIGAGSPGSAEPGRATSAPTSATPLSPDAARTLGTLRKLDDHPLYEMTYVGPLPAAAAGPVTPSGPSQTPDQLRQPFGCTVLVAAGDPQRPMVGRNFDWDPNPALVLYTKPPGGAASISVVDISYLGFDRDHVGDLAVPERRRALLDAPLLPFDGMNEYGLVIGMAAEDRAVAAYRPGRAQVGSVRVMRLVLSRSRTVQQAITVLGEYNIDFTGGPPLHYLVADATGASAIVEFVDGRMRVMRRGAEPWQVMVNFQMATSTAQSRAEDWRYRTATSRLAAVHGRLDERGVLAVLRDVHQPHTQWSVAYDLRRGRAYLVSGQRYERVHVLRMPGS